jgi:predicted PurR-regulated permease PerM
MLALDDRTGNILTTIAMFASVGVMVYAARATVVVLVFALLLAYLLEPAVNWLQGVMRPRGGERTGAIAIVYVIVAAVLGGAAYALEPMIAGQLTRFNSAAPGLIEVATSRLPADVRTSMAGAGAQVGPALATAAASAGWLLVVPVLAIFFLEGRQHFIDATIAVFARSRDRAAVQRTVERIDTMLAEYVRAQLALAGLSFVFYSVSMALLGFPYALPLGLLGGALEFVPTVGWITAAAVMLTTGWLTHAHWPWMVPLIVLWRLVQNFVNSPRIMGNRLELAPMTVFVAAMAGGQIGGLLGVVLAIPVVAVLRILWIERSSPQTATVV